jgi:hypothetical protein
VTSEAEQFLPGSPAARIVALSESRRLESAQLSERRAGSEIYQASSVGEADAVGVFCHDAQQRKAPVGCSR